MKYLLFVFSFLHSLTACSQDTRDRVVGGPCEGCDLIFDGMPETLNWQTRLTTDDEPGEPLEISGVLYKADGKTPAQGVILYVYHTDIKGEYSQAPQTTRRIAHGHLRGWMKTDERGRYSFRSIRPASYPASRAPQHIHPIIKEPGIAPYWIDEYVFEDDPFVDKEYRKSQRERGGAGIIKLVKNQRGVWIGKRDIILGRNIPDYTQSRP